MVHATALHVVLLAGSVLTTAGLAGYAWRHRDEHGALAFFGLMVAFTVYSGTHLFGLLTLHPRWRLLWENVQWTGTAVIPVFWMLFALAYTGHDEAIDRTLFAALTLVPLVTIVLTWTNPWHGLMWTDNLIVVVDGLAILEQPFGPWFWVNATFTYSMIGAGAFLLVRLVRRSEYLYTDQALLLLVGVAVPMLASVMTVFELTPIRNPPLDITPYSFAVTGLTFGYALFHHRLFELVPATRRLGREAAIRDLEDGVVIVDTDRRIVYCNPAAADLLDSEVSAALGEPIRSLVDESALDFDAENALAELDRGDRVHEVRTSPIHDRQDRQVGHTLVVQDATARKRRERLLARQRDELARLEELNSVIRGVNRVLVSATSREEVEREVCDRLADSDLYGTVCAADIPTWNGSADRWTVAGADGGGSALPGALREGTFELEERPETAVSAAQHEEKRATWTVVPLAYGRTVYGVLALCSWRERITDREREVLSELGELIGHAINAVENRRLLAAEAVVELEFRSADEDGTLLGAATAADCRLELTGLVPDGGDGHLAYVRVEGASAESAATALAANGATNVRTIRERADGGLLEVTVSDDMLVGMLIEHGGNVLEATAGNDTATFVVEVASDADVRALIGGVQRAFPHTQLDAKREHSRPIERADGVQGDGIEELTDRQQQALEAAYRAGYFEWPRESTAEEVAETLDIAAPTLHAHLRKAEGTLLADLFDVERTD